MRSRVKVVVADAGYRSNDNVETPGAEALIAPGKGAAINRLAGSEPRRAEVLSRVEDEEITADDAVAELDLGRSRVGQLLLARRRELPPTPAVAMTAKLATPRGQRLYTKRSATVEPVFGQTKHNRGIRRSSRRGLAAVDSEWKLVAATHNLLKLWRRPSPSPC